MMLNNMIFRTSTFMLWLLVTSPAYAVDSYRYVHVTIETPWAIFIFLLLIILFPFVLMAILHWHFASKAPVAEHFSSKAPAAENNEHE